MATYLDFRYKQGEKMSVTCQRIKLAFSDLMWGTDGILVQFEMVLLCWDISCLQVTTFLYVNDNAASLHNASSVVEFRRWWVLKSKVFAQKSTCSKEILIPTSLIPLWFSVASKNQIFKSWLFCSYIIYVAKFKISGKKWVE